MNTSFGDATFINFFSRFANLVLSDMICLPEGEFGDSFVQVFMDQVYLRASLTSILASVGVFFKVIEYSERSRNSAYVIGCSVN